MPAYRLNGVVSFAVASLFHSINYYLLIFNCMLLHLTKVGNRLVTIFFFFLEKSENIMFVFTELRIPDGVELDVNIPLITVTH